MDILQRSKEDENKGKNRREDMEEEFLIICSIEECLWPRKMSYEIHDGNLKNQRTRLHLPEY